MTFFAASRKVRCAAGNRCGIKHPMRCAHRQHVHLLLLTIMGVAATGWSFGQQSAPPSRSPEYAKVQEHLARGWNTWDTNSVTTEVLLPEGLAIHTGIRQRSTEGSDSFLPAALIGRQGKTDERVIPGPHAYNGSYTDLKLIWHGYHIRIQTAHDGGDLVLLATPLVSDSPLHLPPEIVFSADMLWNRPGHIGKKGGAIEVRLANQDVRIYLTGRDSDDPDVPVSGVYLSAVLDRRVGLSTGHPRSIAEIQSVLSREEQAYRRSVASFGDLTPVADAIQTVIGWDTIYEPEKQRVISPVSRIWSVNWGGYVLFDWDTFFAATLAAVGDRDLAYANAIEICREATPEHFVPNYARAHNWKSNDRSEPPVGAVTVLGLYRKFHDRWLLEDTFDALLRWNLWWAEHRDRQGYLVWGSDGENQPRNLDDRSVGTRVGAILESGLDNSPMYDDAVYDPATHQLEYADVGLISMYIADCDALAQIADVLGKTADGAELRKRAAQYRASLETLWDAKTGIFLNRDMHTGRYNRRLSPTNFYPMLAKVATSEQAQQMVRNHLLNPKEFWGEWVIPSIERDDPAFKDQNYWRGRIWGPMNYLVYLGLRNYDSPGIVEARQQLAQKSLALFLKDWRAQGHVHENLNAITGSGDDVTNSDRFYHWGALLGLISLEEKSGTD